MGRGRAGPGDGDVEVLLVDDDVLAPSPGEQDGPRPPRGPRGRRLVRGAVVALVVVTGAGAAQAWQDQTAQAALAGVPGIVPRMDVLPRIAWTHEGGFVRDTAGGMLLVHDQDGGGTALLDGVTGEVRWTAAGPGPDDGWVDCQFVRQGDRPSVWGFDEDAADAVMCRSTIERSGDPVSTRLQVRDARTGVVRAEREIPSEAMFVETLAGDVLHAGYDAEGYLEVVRWDPDADADRWRYRSGHASGPGSRELTAGLMGDVVVVQSGGAAQLVSLEDGQPVASEDAEPARLTVADLADGATVDLSLPLIGRGATVVTDRDGTVRLEVDAWFAGPRVLDPSTPVLLVTDDVGALVAHDVRDGDLLWTRATEDLPPGVWAGDAVVPMVQVAHRLVLAAEGSLEAVDARDGTRLWLAEDLDVSAYGAVSDGRSVIVPARARTADGGTEHVLVALDLRDGVEVWRLPLPGPGDMVIGVGDGLVVQGGQGIVGLRP